jgi:hypothetical protein
MATVHNAVKETIRAHLTLVHVFHVYASKRRPAVQKRGHDTEAVNDLMGSAVRRGAVTREQSEEG